MSTRLLRLLVALLAPACATANVVHLGPLDTAYPVSASSSYVDASSAVVTAADVERVRELSLRYELPGTVMSDTETDLAALLKPDLDARVKEAGGDAVIGLAVYGEDYDRGSHDRACVGNLGGGSLLALGALFTALGIRDRGEDGKGALTVGVGTSLLGAAVLAAGLVAREPSRWVLSVSGTIVRRRSGAAKPVGAGVPARKAAP